MLTIQDRNMFSYKDNHRVECHEYTEGFNIQPTTIDMKHLAKYLNNHGVEAKDIECPPP